MSPVAIRKSQAYGIAFAPTLLDQDRDILRGFACGDAPTLLERLILGMPPNQDELGMWPHRRQSVDERFEVTRLVAAGADHGHPWDDLRL
jgi:hypothetical protein